MVKIIVYILLLSVLGIIAFFLLLNSILYRIFHQPPVPSKRTPADIGLEFRERFVETIHNKKLQLFEIPAIEPSSIVFLCVHGWANTVDSFLEIALHLRKLGAVYLLNTRSHGRSDSEKNMTILKYETDIRHTINYLDQQIGQPYKLVLIGHSLGGAAALLTASEDQRVAAVASISSFANMRKILYDGFMKSNIPRWFVNGLMTYIEFRLGRSLEDVSPENLVKKIKVPILLIHGTKDEVVDFTEMEKIFKQANKNLTQKFVAKGHNHSSLLKDENVAIAIEKFVVQYFEKLNIKS